MNIRLGSLIGIAAILCFISVRGRSERKPEDIAGVWIAPNPLRPDWSDNQGGFRRGGWKVNELFEDEKASQWTEVRNHIKGVKYFVVLFGVRTDDKPEYQLSEAAVKSLVTKHKAWKIKIGIESGWVTGNAQDSIFFEQPAFARIKKYGGTVDYLALDEWLAKAYGEGFGTEGCPAKSVDELAEQAAIYFEWIKNLFPEVRFGTTETVPLPDTAFGLPEVKQWISKLKAACAQKDVTLSVVELDNVAVPSQIPHHFSLDDLLRFELWVKNQGLQFSAIYMSEEGIRETDGSDGGAFPGRPPQTNKEWSQTLTKAAQQYLAGGGSPDLHMIQSWHPVPHQGLPETRDYTFMQTVRAVIRAKQSQR